MASAGLGKELECSICLSLYTDPVTLRCGHNFCRVCIDQVLNRQGESQIYSCPGCRAEFQKRPTLQRNITLCNVVENFRSTQLPQEKTKIFCTYCVDSPVPAVKSCLLCEASLCDKHLKVHSKGPAHILIDPSTSLENWKCSIHEKLLEYYCTEDATCICVSCSLAGEHRGHQVETLNKASEKKKEKLKDVLQILTTKKEESDERVQRLEKSRRKAKEKTSGEAERVTALFIGLRRRLDDLEKKILSEISRQGEKVSKSLFDVIQNLEKEKMELSRKIGHLEELCNMADPLTVLREQDTGDIFDPEKKGSDEDTGGHDGGNEAMGGHDEGDWGAELISGLSHTLSDMIRHISVTNVQDPVDILLNIDTAAHDLLISDDLKTVTWRRAGQKIPCTAERFQHSQVMSSSNITSGRHYWDVEISEVCKWSVGMCYPSIYRRGSTSGIGYNNNSWGLYGGRRGQSNLHSVRHDSNEIQLPHQISSDRFRIYVDYEAGELSFYELCDPIRHLHTFTTTFTRPLHAVLYVRGGAIKIVAGSRMVKQ